MNSMRQFFTKYELLNSNNTPLIVGTGINSAVQVAINKKTEKLVAVKKIFRKQAFKEALIHSMLKDPNIAQFIEFFYDTETNSSFIVLQYISNGTLSEFINSNQILNQQKFCQIFIGICRGLQAIHKAKIIHQDLKPANIVFDEYFNAKICDFGSSVYQEENIQVFGTFEYMAPQILLQKQLDFKLDVWSIGMMMYEVLEKKLPFNEKNSKLQLKRMKQPLNFEKEASIKFRQIIQKMLNFIPEKRPLIAEVIEFLQKVQKSTFKKEECLSLNQRNEYTHLTIFQSQNSTIDSQDEQNYLLIIKNNKKEINLKKVISLKYFHPINQNKQIPKIIITKPLIKKTNEISYLKNISSLNNKISIKQLIKRRNI